MTMSRPYTDRQRAVIAEAWQTGGCLVLGAVLARIRRRFTIFDYAEAVKVAREETHDTTDYSVLYATQEHQEATNP